MKNSRFANTLAAVLALYVFGLLVAGCTTQAAHSVTEDKVAELEKRIVVLEQALEAQQAQVQQIGSVGYQVALAFELHKLEDIKVKKMTETQLGVLLRSAERAEEAKAELQRRAKK